MKGGDKPFLTEEEIKLINQFSDLDIKNYPDIELYLNPIYGLFLCYSDLIINLYFLTKDNLINDIEYNNDNDKYIYIYII